MTIEDMQVMQHGSFLIQYLAAFSCLLNVMTSGLCYGWPSPSLPKLLRNTSAIPTTPDQGSWMAVMPLIGAVVGALSTAAAVDSVGRKRIILFASAPFFASWLMVAFAKSVGEINVARLISGIADGQVFTVAPMYIGEITDPKIRGFLGSCISVVFIFGILLINVVGSYLSIKATALIACILPLITLLTFSFMPESPYFYLKRGNIEEARKSLQRLRGVENVDLELTRISLAIKDNANHKGRFWDLFTKKSNRKAIVVIMILRGSQQLSGVTAISFYAHTIFIEASDQVSPELATIIYFSVQFALSLFVSIIVDQAGRRPLLIASIVGSTLLLFLEGAYFYVKTCTDIDTTAFSMVPIAGITGYIIIFSLGMGTIPILMLGELFSSEVKAFALCFADIYFATITTISSKLFQFMKDAYGMYSPFIAFSACGLVGLVLIILFVPETKGKTLKDIQAYFNSGNQRRKVEEIQNVES